MARDGKGRRVTRPLTQPEAIAHASVTSTRAHLEGEDLRARYLVQPAMLALELHGLGVVDTETAAEAICSIDDLGLAPLGVESVVEGAVPVIGEAQVGERASDADGGGKVVSASHEPNLGRAGLARSNGAHSRACPDECDRMQATSQEVG